MVHWQQKERKRNLTNKGYKKETNKLQKEKEMNLAIKKRQVTPCCKEGSLSCATIGNLVIKIYPQFSSHHFKPTVKKNISDPSPTFLWCADTIHNLRFYCNEPNVLHLRRQSWFFSLSQKRATNIRSSLRIIKQSVMFFLPT